MNGLNITVTGYTGTGASALVDLLLEYDNFAVCNIRKDYEHFPLYTNNGLFDLEDKLFRNNYDIHSDKALKEFYKEMMRLNNNYYGWYGSYKYFYGNQFKELVEEFLNDIGVIPVTGTICEDIKFSFSRYFRQLLGTLLKGHHYHHMGYVADVKRNKKMYFAFPAEEEFYSAARKFINGYIKMVRVDDKNLIFEQLLVPQNTNRLNDYFDDNFKMIIIDRDPRDIYILEKYIWPEINLDLFSFKDVNLFCEYWRRMKKSEPVVNSSNIHKVQFEDLIYNYHHTVKEIEEFLGISSSTHVGNKQLFKPEVSIKNTKVYLQNQLWEQEINVIKEKLPEYLYSY